MSCSSARSFDNERMLEWITRMGDFLAVGVPGRRGEKRGRDRSGPGEDDIERQHVSIKYVRSSAYGIKKNNNSGAAAAKEIKKYG